MVSGRAGRLNRISHGIVLIGQNPLLRKQIAFALRVAGFRIAASVPDADLPFLRAAVQRGHQIISIFEVKSSFDETSRQFNDFRTLYPMGSVALVETADLRDRRGRFSKHQTCSGRYCNFGPAMSCDYRRRGSTTNVTRARKWFRDGEAVNGQAAKSRYLTPEKGWHAGRDADGISQNAASSRAVTPVTPPGERSLTARQATILKSLMNGDSNKVVARRLRIAEETVKVHIKRLLRRIGVKNRTQAAIWGLNNNFTPAPASETRDLRWAIAKGPPRYNSRNGKKVEIDF